MLTAEQLSFLNVAAKAAVASEQATGLPAELSLTQAIFESAWGARGLGNNIFGIQKDGHGAGTQYFLSHEYLNGSWVEKPEAFERYDSIAECFADHARLLTTSPIYSGAWAEYLQDRDLDALIVAVCHKYATDPAYTQKILAEAHSATVQNALDAARG